MIVSFFLNSVNFYSLQLQASVNALVMPRGYRSDVTVAVVVSQVRSVVFATVEPVTVVLVMRGRFVSARKATTAVLEAMG